MPTKLRNKRPHRFDQYRCQRNDSDGLKDFCNGSDPLIPSRRDWDELEARLGDKVQLPNHVPRIIWDASRARAGFKRLRQRTPGTLGWCRESIYPPCAINGSKCAECKGKIPLVFLSHKDITCDRFSLRPTPLYNVAKVGKKNYKVYKCLLCVLQGHSKCRIQQIVINNKGNIIDGSFRSKEEMLKHGDLNQPWRQATRGPAINPRVVSSSEEGDSQPEFEDPPSSEDDWEDSEESDHESDEDYIPEDDLEAEETPEDGGDDKGDGSSSSSSSSGHNGDDARALRQRSVQETAGEAHDEAVQPQPAANDAEQVAVNDAVNDAVQDVDQDDRPQDEEHAPKPQESQASLGLNTQDLNELTSDEDKTTKRKTDASEEPPSKRIQLNPDSPQDSPAPASQASGTDGVQRSPPEVKPSTITGVLRTLDTSPAGIAAPWEIVKSVLSDASVLGSSQYQATEPTDQEGTENDYDLTSPMPVTPPAPSPAQASSSAPSLTDSEILAAVPPAFLQTHWELIQEYKKLLAENERLEDRIEALESDQEWELGHEEAVQNARSDTEDAERAFFEMCELYEDYDQLYRFPFRQYEKGIRWRKRREKQRANEAKTRKDIQRLKRKTALKRKKDKEEAKKASGEQEVKEKRVRFGKEIDEPWK